VTYVSFGTRRIARTVDARDRDRGVRKRFAGSYCRALPLGNLQYQRARRAEILALSSRADGLLCALVACKSTGSHNRPRLEEAR
jgi:hypothetical protein